MVSAREALSSIEQAILGARRDEDRLTEMLRSATDAAARLRADKAEAYKALARLKLDALARDQVVGELDTVEKRALAAIEDRKARLAGLAKRRSDLINAAAAAEKTRDGEAERLEQAIDAVEDLAEKTKKRLAGDKEAAALAEAVAAARATADAGASKAEQAEADREEKRKPYEADPLFMYLWNRGYGTAAYRAGPIVRFFDAKVARVVGYAEARPNYFMLNEIPLRLREHATRLAEAVEEAAARREAYERKALEADGIGPLEAAVAKEEAALKDADAALDDLRAKLKTADEEQARLLDERNDPSLSGAVDELAAALAREDLAALHREALKTPTPEDEKIVKSLREIDQMLARRESEAEEVRKAAVELARTRTELESSRDRFRSSGYDNPRGEFINGAVIGTIITEILRGATSGRRLDDALGEGYRERSPRPGGSFGGGLRFPGGGGFSLPKGGGGMPRPPSMPRGGFRTGGRF